jgi:hypothetical protein
MSSRIVPAILAAAVSVAFGFSPANAQQPQKPQPPQSLRLYAFHPATIENYGLKPSEVASTEMITQLVEVGDLSCRNIKPDRAGIRLFSHPGGAAARARGVELHIPRASTKKDR